MIQPPSEAKQRLLAAAESLFAARGFEVVGVRDITKLAKLNVAAINYHFGTRDALIGLVVARYLTPVNEERLARLEILERKYPGKATPIEELLEVLVRPLVGVTRKSGMPEDMTCRLLGRIFAMNDQAFPAAVGELSRRLGERFNRALGKSLVVAEEELAWRKHFVMGALIHMLLHPTKFEEAANGTSPPLALEATLNRFIRFAAAGLREGVESPPVAKKGPQALFDF